MKRRRGIGRAYDMALEVARAIPPGSKVLDVGCGNGFIAHHLTSLLRAPVVGLDVRASLSTSIEFALFDGLALPFSCESFDSVLLCYVLHHAGQPQTILKEVKRVLRPGGTALVYEDIPRGWWDRKMCWAHNLKWEPVTGPCTFRRDGLWRECFAAVGFEIVRDRRLSRWRNLGHPVSRQFYQLAKQG